MKTTEIIPSALYWASFNRFELRIPGQAVLNCSHSGACDDDVAHWVPLIREQVKKDNFPNQPTDEKIALELAEYGAWSDEELQDTEQNWHRLVWIAAGNILDEESADCSEPVH